MAEEVGMIKQSGTSLPENIPAMIELAVCQPDHPNQAIFVSSLDIKLKEFRTSISENGLLVPNEWVFMTRVGSLLSEDQEEAILLSSITRKRDDSDATDVMLTPSLSQQQNYHPAGGNVPHGHGHLAAFATIVAALRDIYITSIQPNLHELIKPLAVAAAVIAFLSFVLAAIATVSFGALGGFNRSFLTPFLRSHLCSSTDEVAVSLSQMQARIQELEQNMHRMRQVEVGILVCEGESHYHGDPPKVQVSFRKTNFTETPRIIFGLKDTSISNLDTFKLKELRVNPAGFSVECHYTGNWAQYSLQYSWVAVGI